MYKSLWLAELLLLNFFSNSQVNGLVALMDSEHVGPFNLGNPGEFTMLELAQVPCLFCSLTFISSFVLV